MKLSIDDTKPTDDIELQKLYLYGDDYFHDNRHPFGLQTRKEIVNYSIMFILFAIIGIDLLKLIPIITFFCFFLCGLCVLFPSLTILKKLESWTKLNKARNNTLNLIRDLSIHSDITTDEFNSKWDNSKLNIKSAKKYKLADFYPITNAIEILLFAIISFFLIGILV